ncbi:ribose 5-phosphate isomerase B [Peptoniphilus sp. KCTC 25270]|uniref:ribose 5-phosphate isomerase B n=1 Tax=Peptoniphilus sp. KCTC 25270 TaxID=2897414 RepID=UPI001E42BFCB|nr:ribose 5-phosphate isomerase B [Peptoniphilus sp. KCTC 25270]MCD1147978.1 ribose 5-phosphate isomerase B [Peptoniphilus sp. KCTC 25270]
MKIAIGSDHGGFERKEAIIQHLKEKKYEVVDVGTHSKDSVDYPEFGHKAAEKVVSGECEFGILICGSGIGIGIAANKIKGIRCATVSEPYSAMLSRLHNNANMVSFGARIIGEDMSKAVVDAFLEGEYEGGRHDRRIQAIEK